MKTVLNKFRVEWNETMPVARLSVKVLCGKGMGKRSITSDHTVLAVWHVCQLLSLVVQKTGVVNLSGLKLLL